MIMSFPDLAHKRAVPSITTNFSQSTQYGAARLRPLGVRVASPGKQVFRTVELPGQSYKLCQNLETKTNSSLHEELYNFQSAFLLRDIQLP